MESRLPEDVAGEVEKLLSGVLLYGCGYVMHLAPRMAWLPTAISRLPYRP